MQDYFGRHAVECKPGHAVDVPVPASVAPLVDNSIMARQLGMMLAELDIELITIRRACHDEMTCRGTGKAAAKIWRV